MANETKASETKPKGPRDPLCGMFHADGETEEGAELARDASKDVFPIGNHRQLMQNIATGQGETAARLLARYEGVNYHAFAVAMIKKEFAKEALAALKALPPAAMASVRGLELRKLLASTRQHVVALTAPELFGFAKEGQGGEIDYPSLEAFVAESERYSDLAELAIFRKSANFETVEKIGAEGAVGVAASMFAHLPRNGQKLSKRLCVSVAQAGYADQLIERCDLIPTRSLHAVALSLIKSGRALNVFENRAAFAAVKDKSTLLYAAISNNQAPEAVGGFAGDWKDDVSPSKMAVALVRAKKISLVFLNVQSLFASVNRAELAVETFRCGLAREFFAAPKDGSPLVEKVGYKLPTPVARALALNEGVEFALANARWFDREAVVALVLDAWSVSDRKTVVNCAAAIGFSVAEWQQVIRLAQTNCIVPDSLVNLIGTTGANSNATKQ